MCPLPFPPGDIVAAFGRHLHFKGLEQALWERHPDVAARAHFDDTKPMMHLKVMLSGRQSVALAQVRMGYTIVWAVLDPSLDGDPFVWPLDTSDETLVDALHAVASARLTGEPLASPWRWNESRPSDMTELADLLDARGIRVRRVAAGNRYFPYGPRHAPKLDILSQREGSLVEAEFPDTFVRVSLKPALGWLVDAYVPEVSAWARVDLGWNLWGTTLARPGVPRTDVSVAEIAGLLDKGLKEWDVEVAWESADFRERVSGERRSHPQESLFAQPEPPAPVWPEDAGGVLDVPVEDTVPSTARRPRSPREINDSVLDQLTAFGFGDLEEGDAELPIRSDAFHVEWHSRVKDLSTSEVQRLNGLAAAAGEDVPKRLIVITEAGISRPAAAFADKAKGFVFHIDRTTGRLMALNPRARETLLPDAAPGERGLERW
ncbi:hypothetical protein [Streptomyces sp. NPDC127033]|uniref:hypothetical protein n=1 Tax=Streptomyces sp. NPDC127033 TaxID=3347110 RepID=UPI0036493DAE